MGGWGGWLEKGKLKLTSAKVEVEVEALVRGGGGEKNIFFKRFDSCFRAFGSGGNQYANFLHFLTFRKHCRFYSI